MVRHLHSGHHAGPKLDIDDCRVEKPEGRLLAHWAELAGRALVPSGWNRPEVIGAAMDVYHDARVASVDIEGRLVMALPVAAARRVVPVASNWISPVNFYGLPHLDRELAVPAMTAFLRKMAAPVILHSVPRDGALWEVLQSASAKFAVIESWERASLEITGSHEQWFEASFERKRR